MNIKKARIIKILVPLLIVAIIAVLWLIKTGTDKSESTLPPINNAELPEHLKGADFSLEVNAPVDFESLAEYGLPAIIDYGSDSCIPCKEMAPALKLLNEEMYGKAFVKFADVWVYSDAASNVPIQVIPTQVLVNADGTPFVPSDELAAKIQFTMAILIWLMIYPMMMKVDFQSIKNVGKNPKGLFVTWITNWLIKPFTMYGIAALFFFVIFKAFITPDLATEYLAGAVLLGAAPCTAMVFVWSSLTKGDPAYTVVQVATNDLIILIAFIPIVKFLLGVSNIAVPWDTLILSVVLFVVIPLAGGMLTRSLIVKRKGKDYFENVFIHKFDSITTIGLLLTLVMIFSFQGNVILENPLHIVLITIPLILQTFLIFAIAYVACRVLKLPYKIAAPAGMIGASNFFELAVAVAIALFGTTSPAALATTVGVLTEVPVMLLLVRIANKTKGRFPA